jgi:3-deoxy-D-manno-octulosonic-acid transferase
MSRFPSLRLRLALFAYTVLWTLGLPAALLYLRRRAGKDPLYGQHLAERFGTYRDPLPGAVWIHAVSLGELRSAVPLIRALLDRDETVVTTHFTPAGRREAERALAPDIAAGRVRVVWVPFEYGWTFRRFFRAFRPKFGLVMEIEVWPRMVMAARAGGVPLFMCNAQYPSKSFARDTTRTPVRAELMRGFAGALVKSDLQRDRFAAVGVTNIAVTGELRFAQPIPSAQVAAGLAARPRLAGSRRVLAFASVIAGEDDLFLDAIARTCAAHEGLGLPPPFVVYVPRAPERFGETADRLAATGLAGPPPHHRLRPRPRPHGRPRHARHPPRRLARRDELLPRHGRPRGGRRRLHAQGIAQHHRAAGARQTRHRRPRDLDDRVPGRGSHRRGRRPAAAWKTLDLARRR